LVKRRTLTNNLKPKTLVKTNFTSISHHNIFQTKNNNN
jgi:hypothetical protein